MNLLSSPDQTGEIMIFFNRPVALGLFFSVQILQAAPKSEGLTKKNITSVVTANQEAVESCYASTRRPDLPGKFRVEIKVSKTGVVESARVRDSTFTTSSVISCIENAIKKWTFVAPLPKQPRSFSYPFRFGPDLPGSSAQHSVEPPMGSPLVHGDAQVFKGRTYRKSNRAIEDPKVLARLAGNSNIKVKAENCENLKVLKDRCTEFSDTDRVVCSSLTENAPRKPLSEDWKLIEHPSTFRIASGVYFLGYWHIACEFVNQL